MLFLYIKAILQDMILCKGLILLAALLDNPPSSVAEDFVLQTELMWHTGTDVQQRQVTLIRMA